MNDMEILEAKNAALSARVRELEVLTELIADGETLVTQAETIEQLQAQLKKQWVAKMKLIQFREVNAKLVADGCGNLPVYRDGEQCVTCWQLSGEELLAVLQTKRVWLRVKGQSQPPVMLTATDPFEDE